MNTLNHENQDIDEEQKSLLENASFWKKKKNKLENFQPLSVSQVFQCWKGWLPGLTGLSGLTGIIGMYGLKGLTRLTRQPELSGVTNAEKAV